VAGAPRVAERIEALAEPEAKGKKQGGMRLQERGWDAGPRLGPTLADNFFYKTPTKEARVFFCHLVSRPVNLGRSAIRNWGQFQIGIGTPNSCPTALDFAVGISTQFSKVLAFQCRSNRDPGSYPYFAEFSSPAQH
jgi:hypothetical protein